MQDNDADMERGVAQVLSSFTPGAVFSYGQAGFSMMVDNWKVQPMENVDGNRVANHIAGSVREFRNSDAQPWNNIEHEPIDIYRPNEVQGEFFPQTMVCNSCDNVFAPKDLKHLAASEGECDNCGGELQQLQFVLVHECGHVNDIEPKPCSQHGWDPIKLKRGDPEQMQTFGFVCRSCGTETKSLVGACECGEFINQASPLQSGSVYYPQRETIVDIPPVGGSELNIQYGESWARILMHAHIGELDLSQDGVTLEAVASREGVPEEQLDDIRDQLEEVPPETAETIIQTLSDAASGGPGRREIVELNEQHVSLSDNPDRYTQISHELFTFLRATRGYQGAQADLDDVDRHPSPRPLSDFTQTDFVNRYHQAALYEELLDDIAIEDAWVVDNFPLLSLIYGYSRGRPDARKADLRGFENPQAGRDAVTVYGDRSPSEAIILQFDRSAIIDWLIEAGELAGMDAPDQDDEKKLKIWFLENIDPTETQNPFTPIEDALTEQVYELLHSSSHALMGTASEQCGLDSDSISELILPTVPAIILYAESMEHFSLGGMFTLFKTRLHNWVDRAKEHANSCIYDPACRTEESGAACHACLHTSEFTCEMFNKTLNRNVLIGDPGRNPAFWENLDDGI
ncbi:DUF1998 domain-containing protein [Halorubellus salinus]|uniref:DUF1998 domain-containing protein n=1 Tax=Halorubellus salinus TaxID=755309 RepID=UPI001D06A146|nr:DUF1998 domain-containing protein [Halorubellus salinus]